MYIWGSKMKFIACITLFFAIVVVGSASEIKEAIRADLNLFIAKRMQEATEFQEDFLKDSQSLIKKYERLHKKAVRANDAAAAAMIQTVIAKLEAIPNVEIVISEQHAQHFNDKELRTILGKGLDTRSIKKRLSDLEYAHMIKGLDIKITQSGLWIDDPELIVDNEIKANAKKEVFYSSLVFLNYVKENGGKADGNEILKIIAPKSYAKGLRCPRLKLGELSVNGLVFPGTVHRIPWYCPREPVDIYQEYLKFKKRNNVH